MTMTQDSGAGRVRAVARGVEEGSTAHPPSPLPGPGETALGVFIGRWINEGEKAAGSGMRPERIVTSDVYEWAPGGVFVIHSAYGRIGDTDVGGVEIMGYDRASRRSSARSACSGG